MINEKMRGLLLIWVFPFMSIIMFVPGYADESGIKSINSINKSNYLQNGGFENRYDSWTRSIGDISRGSSQTEIISFPYGKSGKALHLSHTGQGYIQFAQTVSVSGQDLIFTASFQASSHEGMVRAFSGSGVAQIGLQYLDKGKKKLGETILINYVKNPFADTPLIGVPRRAPDTYTRHYIEFSGDYFNQNYTIDVYQEIENNLMAINPNDVRLIAIILWCGANHPNAGAELWVTDLSLISK